MNSSSGQGKEETMTGSVNKTLNGKMSVFSVDDVKVHADLQLSQIDFEKRFTLCQKDKFLNRCEFYETQEYEMAGERFIVKKYIKLDD